MDRFLKFQEHSNKWPRNGNCTKVGQINNKLEKMEKQYEGEEIKGGRRNETHRRWQATSIGAQLGDRWCVAIVAGVGG
ncbi:uncharacterized protein E6C27_scaffold133G00830 [Cucumis melo var. makuwa]|uniref:Uncharacterized protein n=1 Tax=Cucumis melo var. makuwa TaxID=1194695 RepID=A0A5A7TY06_CUCMM|nr:uncharacterized protein E6C27_scaffold133G00830 [Cucumis melo var. makuwa]